MKLAATLFLSTLITANSLFAKVWETLEATHPFNTDGVITLGSAAGSVEIVAWERKEISITANKWAADESDLARVRVRIDASPERTTINTEFEKKGRLMFKRIPDGGVDYVIRVPFGTTLESIVVEDGDVSVADVKGPVNVAATTGFTRAVGLASSVSLDNGSGAIVAAFDRIDPSAQITMRTRGACQLTLPANASVTINARSATATVRCDLPVAVTKSRPSMLEGTLGGGGAALEIRTINGAITIQ